MGCWAPPLQYELPHDLQELGKKKNKKVQVHHVKRHKPSAQTLVSRNPNSNILPEFHSKGVEIDQKFLN